MIMKILKKKGGVVEKRGEEETKSMPGGSREKGEEETKSMSHAPVY
jgi:hypothetical protein